MKPETAEGPPRGDNRREPYRLRDLEARVDRALGLLVELVAEFHDIRERARRARERAQLRAETLADAKAPPDFQE